MTPFALVTLACAISGGGPVDIQAVNQLSAAEHAEAERIIDANACLPDNMEALIQETAERLSSEDRGALNEMKIGQPTEGCF